VLDTSRNDRDARAGVATYHEARASTVLDTPVHARAHTPDQTSGAPEGPPPEVAPHGNALARKLAAWTPLSERPHMQQLGPLVTPRIGATMGVVKPLERHSTVESSLAVGLGMEATLLQTGWNALCRNAVRQQGQHVVSMRHKFECLLFTLTCALLCMAPSLPVAVAVFFSLTTLVVTVLR